MTQSITAEALEKARAFFIPKEDVRKEPSQGGRQQDRRLDVGAYLSAYKKGYTLKEHGAGTLYLLEGCLFDESHTMKEAAIIQRPNGMLLYQCFHESCAGKKWSDARQKISGTDNLAPFMSGLNSFNSFISSPVSKPEKREALQAWPDVLATDALHGPAGEFVRLVEPHSEGDQVALLGQFLVAFGSLIGRHVYFEVEADRHYLNLFIALVGETSKGRKGTSWGHVKARIGLLDNDWKQRVMSGLSSGEGLTHPDHRPI